MLRCNHELHLRLVGSPVSNLSDGPDVSNMLYNDEVSDANAFRPA
jgi:hypothetical protein